MRALALAVLVSTCLAACGVATTKPVPKRTTDSCTNKKKKTASFGLINGTKVADTEHPFAALLTTKDSFCSGTFVSPTTVITAGHCVSQYPDDSNVMQPSDVSFKNTKALKLIRHTSYQPIKQVDTNANPFGLTNFDIGVVVFEQPVAPLFIYLADAEPTANTNITLVGFGDAAINDPNSYGKRAGDNRITEKVANNMLRIDLKNGAISAPGDSGGTVMAGNKLVGEMVGGDGNISLLANLLHAEAKTFLRAAVTQGAKICGLDGMKCDGATDTPPTPEKVPEDNNGGVIKPTPTPTPTPTSTDENDDC